MLLSHVSIFLFAACGTSCTATEPHTRDNKEDQTPANQQTYTKPLPCNAIILAPSEQVTSQRFHQFVNDFVVKNDLSGAFSFISSNYKNHHPGAGDGPDAAWELLSPIWPDTIFQLRRTMFKGNFGWLNYHSSTAGEIIDKFRWENGCIVEHWNDGEVWPTAVAHTEL
ncbi:snoal-like polyketide cyclase family [Fusarium pseudocircinatum]|uniref:Snoal-like polyketide cyclase family n=1 Tax=Fusarium pseudocircinatum TaxID=56676 RepID=A0A8H5KHB1_9HYPO|nr:snoal-like polyketide cyclase family [Fusarium pseudocircinatum]